MEIFALIISIIASALLIRNFFLQERTKVLQNQVSDAHAMVHRLERRLIDQPDDSDQPDEYEELKVDSRVEVAFGKFLVKGKIESIAAISASKKHGDRVGFSFRADNDKHAIWLSHDFEEMWLDEDETETAAPPKTQDVFEKLDTATDALLKTASEAKAAGVPEEAISSAIASARGQDA